MSNPNTGKIVRFTLNPATPLSEDELAMLARLDAMPDSEIDFSDIPESPADAVWYKPGAFFSTSETMPWLMRKP